MGKISWDGSNGETAQQQYYFRRLYEDLKKQHEPLFREAGLSMDLFPEPTHLVASNWHQIGPAVAMTPNMHVREYNWLMTQPVKGRNVHWVNADSGDVPGWAEGSLRVAERTLYHHMGLPKPKWLENEF